MSFSYKYLKTKELDEMSASVGMVAYESLPPKVRKNKKNDKSDNNEELEVENNNILRMS